MTVSTGSPAYLLLYDCLLAERPVGKQSQNEMPPGQRPPTPAATAAGRQVQVPDVPAAALYPAVAPKVPCLPGTLQVPVPDQTGLKFHSPPVIFQRCLVPFSSRLARLPISWPLVKLLCPPAPVDPIVSSSPDSVGLFALFAWVPIIHSSCAHFFFLPAAQSSFPLSLVRCLAAPPLSLPTVPACAG